MTTARLRGLTAIAGVTVTAAVLGAGTPAAAAPVGKSSGPLPPITLPPLPLPQVPPSPVPQVPPPQLPLPQLALPLPE
ncbi:MAG: hypothetical protein ACRDY6_13970, partial [Acidimicrobiia bacterium]